MATTTNKNEEQQDAQDNAELQMIWMKTTWKFFEEANRWGRNGSVNSLKPNDPYMGRTAPLTSKRCILYIYSTNVSTEYFKHALYSPFFFSSKCSLFHNAKFFGSCIIHILYTGCAEIKKKNNSGAKGLRVNWLRDDDDDDDDTKES